MPSKLTFFPLGNADCLRINLKDQRTILVDYADMWNPNDARDLRCDLPEVLRRDLRRAGKIYYDVVCFTHLDNDHCAGASKFFYLDYAACYQDDRRIRIKELWVPAAAITEEGAEDDARVIRQEARHRLREGWGIRVFSRPERLKSWFESEGIPFESRAHLITDAGEDVPGFSTADAGGAAFFVHCPFAWRTDEREVEDRNQDFVVLQARFLEGDAESYALLASDVDYDTLTKIVQTTRRHRREGRLVWDLMKLPHHCSYLSLGPDKGENETVTVPTVKWLFEEQGRDEAIIISTSKPIPAKGTEADQDPQPPHRQAANYHRRTTDAKGGTFKVTMESPSPRAPEPFSYEVTRYGFAPVLAAPSIITSVTSTPARAGRIP